MNKEYKDFEEKFKKIIGLTLTNVEYSEIKNELGEPYESTPYYPSKYEDLHSVDYSVFINTKEEQKIEIYWDDQFFQFGIGIKINEKSDFSNTAILNVTTEKIWANTIGQKIIDIEINWNIVETIEQTNNETESFHYPQDVKIIFENNQKIIISASTYNQERGDVYGFSDNILVTNNEETAQKINMI